MSETVKAIRIEQNGGPEEMKLVDVELPELGEFDVLVRHEAVGLNYIDVYFRTGLYPQEMPGKIGMEGSGVVEAIGSGVTYVSVGDRVAYAGQPLGAYSQKRVMPQDTLIQLPESISFEQGAAMMLQGLTVQYLLNDSYKVQAGDTILLHAAAGGVGLIAVQWLKALGARVIGTVGNQAKADLAKSFGCDETIIYTEEDFVARTRELTDGKGVQAVYDSIGKDTFMQSLDCLAPRGTMVSFGNATGAVPAFEIGMLAAKGSLKVTRPTLMTYVHDRPMLESMAKDLIARVESGQVKIEVNQRYPLADAAQAHIDLESRQTTGSTVLLP
ncbi:MULTISPECIES: quinone oxidoreductase [unclassified Marinobacterium]|jgi:NADPH:quinone reductase|uniref:quinone oxidoreductase family protein n=1 Tax=unclassified Marinobacterium TaxID=2644139 RepID=UPI001568722F|nr:MULTISPECIES: quinone oxidoreductase [unclassified Marinobacterium]NRP09928.1 Quinone oxidoreductase 1 [Marinobacterium sp. xm-g-48]NRP16768.1 Quinone oxidoreductase 1 [Marinobacterium sp. xm-a-152]NRP36373.1 Quinone oxidoreductase 1 [Marinobacterium sp. xm-d-579]NRP39448.1 Quinone oxidoreductase 1 [Marinobacterium sp. xm-a-121]NRP47442.1 Quinone oxidoreductase 1 [Marinobacterium sp. xm-d-543]